MLKMKIQLFTTKDSFFPTQRKKSNAIHPQKNSQMHQNHTSALKYRREIRMFNPYVAKLHKFSFGIFAFWKKFGSTPFSIHST